jgi:hypothetical protein
MILPKLLGAFLLIAGGILVMCAVRMLPAGAARNAFVLAGMGVEALGLVLAVRAHIPVRSRR